jgi:hypothetical protein
MVAQIAEIIDVQEIFGQTVLDVFHFVDGAGTADIDTLVDDFIADYIPAAAELQADDLTHTAVKSRLVYPTASLMHTDALASPVPGDQTDSDPMASAYAYSMAWEIDDTVVLAGGFAGHIKRGGMRLPGPVENSFNGNTTAAFAIASWVTAFAVLLNPGEGGWDLCVASFLDGARARQTTVQAYARVSGSSAPAPSTQNTRKVLRGRTR